MRFYLVRFLKFPFDLIKDIGFVFGYVTRPLWAAHHLKGLACVFVNSPHTSQPRVHHRNFFFLPAQLPSFQPDWHLQVEKVQILDDVINVERMSA